MTKLLHYRIYAEGGEISFRKPVMVLIHGLGGSSAIWLRQVHKLKAKYDLLLIDMPSHGKTTHMFSEMEVSFDSVTNLVMEVLNHLHIEKATFVGCSLGTMVVKHIVAHYPQMVEKYVLIGAVGDYPFWFRFGLQTVIALLPIMPLSMMVKLVARVLIPRKQSDYSRNLFLSCAKHIPKQEFIAWLKLLTQFPKLNTQYLPRLKTMQNGLYITGTMDYIFLPSLKRELKSVTHFELLEHCGHVCNLDAPDEVNELLLAFEPEATPV